MSVHARAFDPEQETPIHYEAGFIVLSYVISLVGCMSTLELLHRRTSCRGAFNWYLLIASSITMGGIGIWSMHFVGNRAIILANGAPDLQLVYNQGYTALSFFLPIMVLVIAFYVLAISGRASKVNTFIAGVLTGTAVCAMHYVGQVGIANYDCTYQIGNIIGAAVIAVVASLIALSVFFRLREMWTDSWWKRSLCAALLAGAVSGMHWTAAVGTIYHPRSQDMNSGSRTRVQTVIFCAVLSLASCVLLLAIAFATRHRARVHRRRAQELVLACAYFDENDRIMVTHDGFLPYQKITNQFVGKTFGEDELNRSHPAFMWVYEASRNWVILQDLVPMMQDFLDSDPVARKFQPNHEDSIEISRAESADFGAIFKQLFCVAAERLANQLHEPLEDLGVMFEEPLETGTTKTKKTMRDRMRSIAGSDLEQGRTTELLGKGRYLVVNRRLTKPEAATFAARGYRFGSIFHVAESLGRKMQVDAESVLSRLQRMKICISRDHLHPTGVHVACFLLRPNIRSGFDILVPTVAQNQLPLITLPVSELTSAHMDLLRTFDEWTVRDILKELIPEEPGQPNSDKDFRWQLYSTFVRLVDMVNDPTTMMEAKFSAKPVRAPCRSPESPSSISSCILLSIRYLGSIHHSYCEQDLTYVPFDFFSAQQVVETSASRHEAFRRNAEIEFGECFEETRQRSRSEPTSMSFGDTTRAGSTGQRRQSSAGSYRGILARFGYRKKKPSRNSSRTGLYTGMPSGRSTAEPEVETVSPTSKVTPDPVAEEIHELKTIDNLEFGVKQEKALTPDQQSNEIETVSTISDSKGTYVGDLFALFGLSNGLVKPSQGKRDA